VTCQTFALTPRDRGKAAPVDYRQVQIAEALGGQAAQNAALRASLADLVQTMGIVAFGAGSVGSALTGLNQTATLGTGAEAEVSQGVSTAGPFVATADPWTTATADAMGKIQSVIERYETVHGVAPNTIWTTSRPLRALQRNLGLMSLIDTPLGLEKVFARLAEQGIERLHVGRPGLELADDVMLFAYAGPAGDDPRNSYQPIVIGATDLIDVAPPGGDYQMGVPQLATPALSAAIGVRMWAVMAGSIHKVRCASNFDAHADYRGIARLINIFAGR
jgi:hypothetical protein